MVYITCELILLRTGTMTPITSIAPTPVSSLRQVVLLADPGYETLAP